MSDDEALDGALRRLGDLWHPWYEITYDNGLWHARCRADGAEFHAPTDRELHFEVSMHYMDGLRLPILIPPAN